MQARGPHARPHVAYSMVSTSHGGGALVVVVVMGEKSRGQTRGLPLLGVIGYMFVIFVSFDSSGCHF
jgi:hypothetical protein